jgi:hypothetical protein
MPRSWLPCPHKGGRKRGESGFAALTRPLQPPDAPAGRQKKSGGPAESRVHPLLRNVMVKEVSLLGLHRLRPSLQHQTN